LIDFAKSIESALAAELRIEESCAGIITWQLAYNFSATALFSGGKLLDDGLQFIQTFRQGVVLNF
jgi:hypothetical protein